ncbi:MAG: sodium:solute symporter family protein [Fimbriimonadales bacterium]
MVNLAPADYIVLALFFCAVLALGFSAKLKENSTLQLVAAGRALTMPLFVATLVATWYGGVLGSGQLYGLYGLATLTINGLPYWTFGVLFALIMAKQVRREPQISIPERIERCYGKTCGLISAALVILLASPAAFIMMLGSLLAISTGMEIVPATALGAVVGTLFLYRGGLLADARSNTISFVMMYAAFITILVISIAKYGSPAHVASQIEPIKRTWDAGNGLAWVLSWFLVGSWTFVDPGFHQRVASVHGEQAAKRGVLLAVVFWVIFDTMTTMTAMYAMHALQPPKSLELNLFPIYGSAVLPDGVRGVFFAGMFGALLAATVGYTFISGSTLGRDLLGRIKENATEAQLTLYTRVGLTVATVLGIVLALWAQDIVILWYAVPSMVIPGLFVPVIGAYVARVRPAPSVALACLVLSSAASLGWYLYNLNSELPVYKLLTPMILGTAVAVVIWGLGSVILPRRENHG